ncbi:MAG: sigma 54-interacting transcriptional regulator [Deltaproteobacteria bacterium]|nr:sigma 54-interacting transcriptional regulator [Nannocystaceae bacterium]
MIQRAVRTNLPVLLVGASGTGKESIARILHHFGGGEVPSMEIVRGNEQPRLLNLGAFTYLSRLEDLSLDEQARLPALTGLGRIVIGTRLRPESEEGRVRLHPQIVRWASGIRIDVASLAERIEDLEQVAMDIIAKTPCRRPVGGIADNALDCLRNYRWPGNMDELAEVITHAIASGSTEQIELRDLPAKLRVRDVHHARAESPERQLCLEEAEKQAIRRALNYARGNKRKAARLLHIGKTTLYRKLKQYDLE